MVAMRAFASHEHRTAAALLALLVLAHLWPALIGGQLLAPLAELYKTDPWRGVAPEGIAQYWNQNVADVPISYYPWAVLARDLLHAGTFPAWNPYAFAGTPFFANYEVGWLSPFNLPLWILPLHYGLGLSAALKLWVAGFGTYLLGRELRLGRWAALLAGVCFALCAFHVIWMSYSPFTAVSALLPWGLWLVERIVRRGHAASGPALAAVVALVLVGGHPGTAVHVLGALLLYAAVRLGTIAGVGGRERLRRGAWLIPALALGVLLAAVVLLPAQQAAIDTAGSAARESGGTEFFPGSDMPASVLLTTMFPDWWGRPSELFTAGPAFYSERTLYAGAIGLVLAALALLSPGGWRRKAPFAVLGALGAAMAVRAPGVFDVLVQLPGFDRVQNQRMLLLAQLAIAILAGFGLQALLDAPRAQARAWIALAAAGLAALVAIATLDLGGGAIGDALGQLPDRAADPAAAVASLALASVGWWLAFAAALAAILLLARRRPASVTWVGALVVLVAALDMLRFAHGFQPLGPASKLVPPRTPAIAFLQRRADEGRIAGFTFAIANDYSTVYGLRDARGYDAPQPSLRFHRMWRLLRPGQLLHTSYGFDSLTRSGLQVLGLLGARFVAAPPGTEIATRLLTPVYRGPDATIFRNALAAPRAFVAASVAVAEDEDAEYAAIATEGFDPRRDAVVRRDELGDAVLPGAGGRGSVRVVAEGNAEVTLRATLPRAGLVVLDDAWAPGWRVEVDGRPARALQTDMVLRGVVVPAGTHEVVWRYRVPGLRLGTALSLAGLLGVLGWSGWLVRRRRR